MIDLEYFDVSVKTKDGLILKDKYIDAIMAASNFASKVGIISPQYIIKTLTDFNKISADSISFPIEIAVLNDTMHLEWSILKDKTQLEKYRTSIASMQDSTIISFRVPVDYVNYNTKMFITNQNVVIVNSDNFAYTQFYDLSGMYDDLQLDSDAVFEIIHSSGVNFVISNISSASKGLISSFLGKEVLDGKIPEQFSLGFKAGCVNTVPEIFNFASITNNFSLYSNQSISDNKLLQFSQGFALGLFCNLRVYLYSQLGSSEEIYKKIYKLFDSENMRNKSLLSYALFNSIVNDDFATFTSSYQQFCDSKNVIVNADNIKGVISSMFNFVLHHYNKLNLKKMVHGVINKSSFDNALKNVDFNVSYTDTNASPNAQFRILDFLTEKSVRIRVQRISGGSSTNVVSKDTNKILCSMPKSNNFVERDINISADTELIKYLKNTSYTLSSMANTSVKYKNIVLKDGYFYTEDNLKLFSQDMIK